MSITDPTGRERRSPSPGGLRGGRAWDAALAGAVCAAIALALSWVQAQNPLFGVPVDHPSSVVFIISIAVVGVVGTLVQRGRRLATLPRGELHDEVKRLADAGETARAIRLHIDLTGFGPAEAEQAVAAYLADKTRDPA